MTHPRCGLRHLRTVVLRQGRYKSLIVEEDRYLAALLHYVHLNPVRAGICSVEELRAYRWSSYWYLQHPKERPDFMDLTGALRGAGGLADTAKGRTSYSAYLKWLATNEPARKEMEFDKMYRGWALGTKDFKRALVKSEGLLKEGSQEAIRMEGKELREVNELLWESVLSDGLQVAGKGADSIANDRKSAAWKIEIAAALKCKTSAQALGSPIS